MGVAMRHRHRDDGHARARLLDRACIRAAPARLAELIGDLVLLRRLREKLDEARVTDDGGMCG
jgi:hypothetical protein